MQELIAFAGNADNNWLRIDKLKLYAQEHNIPVHTNPSLPPSFPYIVLFDIRYHGYCQIIIALGENNRLETYGV